MDEISSQLERPECSAGATRHCSQLTQSQTVSLVPSELHAGSIPANSHLGVIGAQEFVLLHYP